MPSGWPAAMFAGFCALAGTAMLLYLPLAVRDGVFRGYRGAAENIPFAAFFGLWLSLVGYGHFF